MTVNLTNEQAEWLKGHLDILIENAHWGQEGSPRGDALEHAQTIHDKIDKELKSREW